MLEIYKKVNKTIICLYIYIYIDAPSKILKISNIISIEKLALIPESELNDTCYDITEELKNHGELVSAFIVKP